MDVANDSGYAFRKTYANGKKIIFSSLAGEVQESAFDLLSANNQHTITVDGYGSWSFGDTAQSQSSLATHSQDHDWIFSSQYLAGLLLAISKCISPNTYDVGVRLTTGLPYVDFNRGKEFRNGFKHFLLGDYYITRNDVRQRVEITSVLQVPQAFGPVFYHILDDRGELKKLHTDRDVIQIGSVNVGGNTVEVGTIILDLETMELNPIEKHTFSRDIGIFTLLPIFRQQMNELFPGEFFNDFELLDVLKSGCAYRYDEKHEIDLSLVKEHLRRSIEDFLSNVYGNEGIRRLYAILSTGGGANLLDLSNNHTNIWQSDNPTWDTCLGYAKLRKLVDRNRQQ
jgi:hypothetical protein